MIDFNCVFVSFFNDIFDRKAKTVSLAEILRRHETAGEFPKVQQFRDKLFEREYDTWNEFNSTKSSEKKNLRPQCWTPSCCIYEGMQRKDENIESLNGLLCIDLDYKDQAQERQVEFGHLKETICKYPWVAYCAESLSGMGYFILAHVGTMRPLKQVFEDIKEELMSDGWVCDSAASSNSNFRFVSYDPEPYVNPDAEVYHAKIPIISSLPETKIFFKGKKVFDYDRESSGMATEYERIEQILQENPGCGIADDYNDWFQVGLAFVDTFGEKGRALFHQYSALSSKYKPSQCDHKYTSLFRTSRGCHTLATFYHVCEQHIGPLTPLKGE